MAETDSQDTRFAQIALRLGYVTQDQLDRAVRIQERNLELGLEIHLEEILLKLDHIKAEQADTIHNALAEKATLQPEARGEHKVGPPPGLAVRGETLLDFQGEMGEEPEEPAPPPPLTASAVEEKDTVMGGPPVGIPDTTIGGPETKEAPKEGEAGEKRKGKWIGPYRIVQEIGRGGMGVVHKAFDPSLKRLVALKVLIGGGHASDDAIERFKREAEAVAKLGHHPGIVPVYDMGSEENLHYIAMAFVAGKSLSHLVDAGEVTPRRALVITEQVARALQFAHQHGVLHRDVKPDNILLDAEGTPALTDFGLAKDIQEDSHLTVSGTAMGTPQYMPPEQADGVLEKIDARSDVYSLGATLYETLTHVPPFTGPSYQNVIFQVLNEEVLPPRKRNPAVPKDVETICLKTLEKDPLRRYQSAEELAEDIRRYLDGHAITARPASLVYRISKKVRRNLPLYATGFVATILLVAAAVFFLGLKPAMDKRREVAEETEILEAALQKRLAPEAEARVMMEDAEGLLRTGQFEACGATCDKVVEKFTPLQGKQFKAIPRVRHPEVATDRRFLPLWRPYTFPLAQALVLKARALQKGGDEEASLHAWLLAYARARTSVDEGEAAVGGPALLQIGKRLLAQGDLPRAKATFQRFLRSYGEHEQIAGAWLGLGKAFWSEGNFAAAREALTRAERGAGLSASEREMIRWTLEQCALFSARRDFPRPKGQLFVADAVGDDRPELLAFDPKGGFSIFRLGVDGLKRLHHVEPEALLGETPPEDRRFANFQWLDRNETGGGAVLLRTHQGGPHELVVIPFRNGEPCADPIRYPVTTRANHIHGADLDGDGTDEILLADYSPPAQLLVLGIESGALRKIDQLEFRSNCHHVIGTDVEGDGREEFVLVFGEYSGWAAFQLRAAEFGGSLQLERLSPFRFLGPISLVTGTDEKDRRFWIYNRSSGDDRRILKGITDPKYILETGLFRLLPDSEELPEDFTPYYLGRRLSVGQVRPLIPEGMVMAHVSLPDRRMALGLRPLDRGRPWALHPLPPGERLGLLFGVDLDDDPSLEVVLELGESLRVFGVGDPGTPEEETLIGVDSEAEDLQRLENPFLATALEMAAMEWREEALGLFRKAREVSVGLLEERRALLGEADCLVRLDRAEEAMKIYRSMIRTSAAGIAEELFSIVELLRQ
ncbi:MAG: protein kinase domain-containing protein, partial [Planctomycetota bacterium]